MAGLIQRGRGAEFGLGSGCEALLRLSKARAGEILINQCLGIAVGPLDFVCFPFRLVAASATTKPADRCEYP